MITVFTPTYNRAYKIKDLYKSLIKQTDRNFEWLVIDDGSTDGTKDLIRGFAKKDNGFKIRFYEQEHGGKHRAMNKAFDLAKGEYFFTVDSDDELTEDAIQLINSWIAEIDEDKIAGVAGLRINKRGQILGGDISKKVEYMEASNFERAKFGLLGDKAEVYKTAILKKHKFPEYKDENFVTEDVCYQEIAHDGYKLRWYNRPIYICEYLDDGLTRGGANELEGHLANPRGYAFFVKRALDVQPFRNKHYILRDYMRTKRVAGGGALSQAKGLGMSLGKYLFCVAVVIPLSYVVYVLKKKFIWKMRRGK